MFSQTATTRKSCKNYDQIGCLSILNSFNPSFSHSNQFKVASKSQIKLEKSNQCRLWEKFLQNSIYRTVSIKRPYLIFFQKSLLNVPYDRKKEGLNILSYRSYNRVVRVLEAQKATRKPPESYKKFQGRNPEIFSLVFWMKLIFQEKLQNSLLSPLYYKTGTIRC